jgi:lysophospholipase L1-like esterase
VSTFLPGAAQGITGHHDASQASFVSTAGDHAGDAGGAAYPTTISDWFFLNGVDVLSPSARGAVVALGDSITNGAVSSFNQNRRWPDFLARRLLASGARTGVLDQGIDGDQLLTFRADCCPTAVAGLARLDRDVLAQTGVTHAIVLLGVNDIGFSAGAPALVAGLRQLETQLHARGIRVIGGTITPFAGSIIDTPDRRATRQAVNAFIRTSRVFDGVVDFDRAVRDPANPEQLLAAFDSGDHLHPHDPGYQAMGAAVNLALLR